MKAFTLIELLVVIAIIAVLSVVVILSLNPADLLRQTRDSGRISDMDTVNRALGLTQVEGLPFGTANTVYVSIPDPTATSTAGDQCQGLGLSSLPATYTYHCAASSTYRQINGTGWVPVNFTLLAQGTPMGQLPQDPINTTSSRLYYTYVTNGYQYEITAIMESQKYQIAMANDGGSYDGLYQRGPATNLTPPFRSQGLVGYWPMDEGSGSSTIDVSGNGNTGSWSGTQVGTSGYYSAGQVGPWAGAFDGSTSMILKPSPQGLPTGNAPRTMSVWFRRTGTIPDMVGLVAYGNVTDNSVFGIAMWGTTSIYGTPYTLIINDLYGITAWVNTGHQVSDTSWHNVVATTDGNSNVVVYLDGSSLYTGTHTWATASSNLYIGRDTYAGNSHWNGLIDDVRIYNRALSAAEVQTLYNAEK